MSLPHLTLRTVLAMLALSAVAACARGDRQSMSASQRSAIADTLRTMITSAYDLSTPGDAVARLMSLYPDTGVIVSASGGQVTTSRADLEAGIRAFWENVGRNMREPKWTWSDMRVDVLGPDAATVTSSYRVPHRTPTGAPHVIAGAWTAVFERRGGRWVIVQEHLSDVPAAVANATSAEAHDSMPGMHHMPGTSEPTPTTARP